MAKKNLKKGIFITFEGPEGSGKSTQSRLLYDYLIRRSYDSIYTREPGGTKVGDNIRHILLHLQDIHISDLTELFLFEANRAQLVDEVIKPSLLKKKVVICDRFSDATLSYQGYGGRIPLKIIRTLDKVATAGLKPDLTILLDVDTTIGLKRAKQDSVDRMEAKDIAYHKRVRAGYLRLARLKPNRIKVIKVNSGVDTIQGLIKDEVERVLQRYKGTG